MNDDDNTDITTEMVETVPVVNALPLRLSFVPEAIREHFDDDEDFALDDVSDEVLRQVGAAALTDDRLYQVFHEVLVDALREHA